MSDANAQPGWEVEHKLSDDRPPCEFCEIVGPIPGLNRTGVIADTLNRDHCIDPELDRKNAKALSAAFDLLAACKSALALLDKQREEHAAALPVIPGIVVEEGPIAKALRAAITKAESR